MTGGFIGMIFGFFTALFRISLIAPSIWKMLVRIKVRETAQGIPCII